ncbi:bifunctional riboflavin kinase/FAD synthetase [Bacillus lacus]|uniref:Riboflavin biosynthesis protein n=1 Tax=Metabacillus lacus TaxID=1983721 RepID=A0A7X2IVM9_9BACI|nr:bifunctional riboflavin kinase/FAD synthetase [Metabacillus lacus]
MKTIKLSHPQQLPAEEIADTVLALGYFDGVHKGHQEVMNCAGRLAGELGLKSAVMTFDPHPSVVLSKQTKAAEYITPLEDKIDLVGKLGIDILYIVEFSEEFASLEPQEFVDQFIIGLKVKHVVAGFDFSYGRLGKGSMETMPFHSRGMFTHTTISKLTDHNRKISSTLIREVIKSGDVAYGASLLGRPHFIRGTVIHGDKRGRTIGFPTANIGIELPYIMPPTGVYATTFELNGVVHEGVCNIGYKPTFKVDKDPAPSIEVHLFQFSSEIYGEKGKLSFFQRIRSEQKFHNVEELIERIGIDKKLAEEFFQKRRDNPCFLEG